MAKFTRKKRPSVEIGQIFNTSHGECRVVSYTGYESVTVEFCDGYTKEIQVSQLKTGKVRNPYFKSVYGIGFLGEGEHIASNKDGSAPVYRVWSQMLARCYSKSQQAKQPSYVGVTVCDEWHNFQNFAEWYENNKVEGWVLDKDFDSPEEAFAFYKQHKEARAKVLAEKYKDNLSAKAVIALMNYQINIGD